MVRQKESSNLQSDQNFTPTGPINSGQGQAVLPNPKNGVTGSQRDAASFPGGMIGVDVGATASEDRLVEGGTRFDTTTNYREIEGQDYRNTGSLWGTPATVPDPDLINRGYTEVPGAVPVNTPIVVASAPRSRFITPDGAELSSTGQPANIDAPHGPKPADPSVPGVKYNPTTYTS